MNDLEKLRLERVASLGCIVCKLYYGEFSPANIHHLTGIKYRSTGKKAREYIPLCLNHHQYGSRQHPAIHSHPENFRSKYGTQEFLLEYTNKLLTD